MNKFPLTLFLTEYHLWRIYKYKPITKEIIRFKRSSIRLIVYHRRHLTNMRRPPTRTLLLSQSRSDRLLSDSGLVHHCV